MMYNIAERDKINTVLKKSFSYDETFKKEQSIILEFTLVRFCKWVTFYRTLTCKLSNIKTQVLEKLQSR